MTLKELSPSDYETYASRFSSRSFMQTREMANLLSKRGYKISYLGWEEDKQIQVTALLFTQSMAGGLRMEINSGPASRDTRYLKPFYHALQAYAKKAGALELVIKPYDTYQNFNSDGQPLGEAKKELLMDFLDLGYQHDGLQTGYPDGEPDWHYVKDLSGLDEAQLLKSFSQKGRSLVKKSKTFGIKIRVLNREELPTFKAITSATSERREYTDKPLDYYQDLYDSWGDKAAFTVASLNFQDYLDQLNRSMDNLAEQINQIQDYLRHHSNSSKKKNQLRQLEEQLETFVIRKNEAKTLIDTYGTKDVILAGSLFIYTPQEAVYLFSGSFKEFNKFYAPALLQQYAILEAIRRGIHHYNLLGITGEFDGTDGVLRFKQNFNGSITRKMGTFHYYPRPLKYKMIQGLKKILGR